MDYRAPDPVFNSILVGCDGSPEGSDAAVLGAELASLCGAALTLVGVFAYPLLPMPEGLDAAARKRDTELLLRRERDLHARGALIRTEHDSSVPRALRRAVRRAGADLVVLGSAANAPAARTRPGPHARHLLHDAPCAAAIAPKGYQRRHQPLLRIAVGYDGGDEARTALKTAAELARRGGGRVHIHQIVDNRVPIGLNIAIDAITGRVVDWDALMDAEREKARRSVEEAAASLAVPVEASVGVGDPGAELRDLSKNADLFVLGSLRLARRERLGIGATSERMLEGASCPVIVVPRPQAATVSAPAIASDRRLAHGSGRAR